MAEDLRRVIPEPASGKPQPVDPNAGTWRDPKAYDAQYLSQVGGKAITDVYEGLSQMPGAMYDIIRGFMERQRQKDPEELRGSADPYDTAAYDAAIAAIDKARAEPVETGKKAAKALGEYFGKATAGPAGATQFLAENFAPLPRVPKMGKPVMTNVVRPKNSGQVLEEYSRSAGGGYTSGYVAMGRELALSASEDKRDAISEFFKTKARNYFVKQFGTADDPIFKAIKEGQIETQRLGEVIRPYAVKAAREGKVRTNPATGESRFYPSNPEAIEDISKAYDQMTGMRGAVFANQTIGRPDYKTLALPEAAAKQVALNEQTIQQLIDQGLAPYEINPNIIYAGYVSPEQAKGLSPKDKIMTANLGNLTKPQIDAFASDRDNLLNTISTAIQKGEPLYDMNPSGALSKILAPKDLVDYLDTLPVEKIKNIRFEDAVKASVKAQSYREGFQSAAEKIRTGKAVPETIFLKGVSGPILSFGKDSPFEGYTWRRILDPEATAIEGAYIGHSVGGFAKHGGYGPTAHKDFVNGTRQVYSLRDPRGRPVTTIEVNQQPDSPPMVSQIKGNGAKSGNSAPEKYDQAVADFLAHLKPSRIVESDSYLPPLTKAYKDEFTQGIGKLRARVGAGQPIGAPPQEGIGQLGPEQAPALFVEPPLDQLPPQLNQRLERAGLNQFQRNLLAMLRRRMMEDDDRGPEGEE